MTHDPSSIRLDNDPPADAAGEADRLMSRMMDHEATRDERARFEALAQTDLSLWRELAERQLDMGMLARGVAQRTEGAETVPLPRRPRRRVPSARLAMTLSGWAAVLVVGLVWWFAAASSEPARVMPADREPPAVDVRPMSADELIDAYLRCPNVLGELEPILLGDTVELDDGRVRARRLRRFEEYVILDPPAADAEE